MLQPDPAHAPPGAGPAVAETSAGAEPDASTPPARSSEATPLAPVWLWAGLFGVGLSWGLTQIFMKGAMAGGFHPVGAALWQAGVGAAVTAAAIWLTRTPLPRTPRHLGFYAVCGLLGTALPASLAFAAIVHLPVGVQALMISTVPLMTVALALPLGLESVTARRLGGVALGFLGIAMIILPEASLPGAGQAFWIALPAMTALSYATENVVIDRFRPADTGTLAIGCGLLWSATAMLLPVVLILDLPVLPGEIASRAMLDMIAVTILNIAAYLGFVWLIGRAGPIFSSQVGYIVTATGVITGIVFLCESHAWTVWLAMALLFAGIALVSPRRAR
ncbi:MAG: DMT family transporter [Pseudomonadota bacterium]